METKRCSRCKVEKPKTEFFKANGKKIGVRGRCKECDKFLTYSWRERKRSEYNNYAAMWRAKNPEKQHKSEIKRRYGLSIEKYNEMLTVQECKCKICGKQHDSSQKRGRLYVDHCHDSSEIRGLLCHHCNIALGCFRHDSKLLLKAIEYLKS